MELLPGDILLRAEQGGKTTWISQRLVMEACCISDGYLRKRARSIYVASLPPSQRNYDILPDNGNAWRWAKMEGSFYYALNRIPNRAPKFYRDCLPTESELKDMADQIQVHNKAEFTERVKRDIVSRVDEFFNNEDVRYFQYQSEPTFNTEKSKQLAEAKAWCRFITTFTEGGRFKRLGVRRVDDFYNICTTIIQNKNLEGFHIKTTKALRKKLYYFPALDENQQRVYLVSGKYGNSNARKVGKFKLVDTLTGEELPFDIHQTLIFDLYMNPGGPEKEDLLALWMEYKNWLGEWTNEEPVAYRTFCQYCSSFDTQLKTAKSRHGEDYYRKHYLTYVPSEQLKYAHSLFAGDGSATVSYHYYNDRGECRRMNLYVILISDIASGYIAGWAPAIEGLHNETPRMTEQAVKMSVESGNYQTMFEIVTDNHGAFTASESKELLGSIFNKVRTIKVGNSQANPAETQFRLFKKTLKRFNNFFRSSWSAGINNQANPDFIPNNEMLPTYDEAVIQMQRIINDWNNKPMRDGTTPVQRFERKHPDCTQMDDRQLRRIFGYKTSVEITRMRGFVDVWKGERLFKFEIPGYYNGTAELIAKATGYRPEAQVMVYWDQEAADLYSLDGNYLVTCKRALKSSQAAIESDEITDYALGHHLKRQNQQIDNADEFEKQISRTADILRYGMAEPENYSIATTDSNFSKEDYNANMETGLNHNDPVQHNDIEDQGDGADLKWDPRRAFDDF